MTRLRQFADPVFAGEAAAEALGLMRELYPICRSITGDGVRRTLDLLERGVPLDRTEVPTGTKVFDWEIPNEWNIRDAWVADSTGRRVIDFRRHNLHVVNYSTPVRLSMTLDELQPHLHSLPERPDWIPYRTSYYRASWGFCLKHSERERLRPGRYEVVIDADLAPGSLTYAECTVPGTGAGEAIIYTHSCHPSLANDNLTGLAVAAALARALRADRPRLTWRVIFGPGTIGSLAWLARNEERLADIRGGLVIGLLGDHGPLTYKRSRQGESLTDRVAEFVLHRSASEAQLVDFEPYGYDERQFCSPGFDLPIGRLTRSPNGAYAEYHSSADDLAFISAEKIAESLQALSQIVTVLDINRFPVSLCPKGEPRLGKRGLYGSVGGAAPAEFERALLWIMNQADGRHDLVSIARRSALPFDLIERAATALEDAGLIACVDTDNGSDLVKIP